MRIRYVGNFSDLHVEGLMSIVRVLKKSLSKKYDLVIGGDEPADLVHIHSSGFLEAVSLKEHPSIFSLHSNANNEFFKIIHNYYGYYRYVYDPEFHRNLLASLKTAFFTTVSHAIPLWVKKSFLKKADVLVLPNNTSMQRLKLPNTVLIRQGIDTKKFIPKPRKSSTSKKKIVAYFGHASPGKGVLDVPEVFQLLGPDYECHMYLTQVTDRFKAYVDRVSPKTKVFGKQDNIVKAYQNVDIVLLPYRQTMGAIANPFVLLESMSCEKLVVTTDFDTMREIGGSTILYTRPGDFKAMAHTIKSTTTKTAASLGKNARIRAVKFYDQKDMLKQYADLYKDLLT
jgi:glycosyltransferase involved in cell wall biosynthesis